MNAPLLHLSLLMIYLMPCWRKKHKAARGFEVSPVAQAMLLLWRLLPADFSTMIFHCVNLSTCTYKFRKSHSSSCSMHAYIHACLRFLIQPPLSPVTAWNWWKGVRERVVLEWRCDAEREWKESGQCCFSAFNGKEWGWSIDGSEGLFLLGPLGVKTPIKCKEQNTLKTGALTLAVIPKVALFTWWEVSEVLYSKMESYTHADVCSSVFVMHSPAP